MSNVIPGFESLNTFVLDETQSVSPEIETWRGE